MKHIVHMKHQVSTSLEPSEKSRVRVIADKLHVSESWVLRRAIVQGLADVEKEVLGVSAVVVIAGRKAKAKEVAA